MQINFTEDAGKCGLLQDVALFTTASDKYMVINYWQAG